MAEKTINERRKDSNRIVLRKGEWQRPNGTYDFRWTDSKGKRRVVYAKTLKELREKEAQIERDRMDHIRADARTTTINDIFDLWCQVKRGLKDHTFQNYKYMYELHVKPDFGKKLLADVKKSDVKRFYNVLADERKLKITTIDNIHTVLHQVLDLAVDDDLIRSNPSNSVLKELKQSHAFLTTKRSALTRAEEKLFLDYLRRNHQYHHWYPIFALMDGTGLRVGEATGLRWCDIDFENNLIDVNHTLLYYNHRDDKGCYFSVNTPKTAAGRRLVPMSRMVRDALLEEKHIQEQLGIHCKTSVDGYTDFIFVNRFGNVQHQGTLNKALRRIMRDCNDEILMQRDADDPEEPVLLPRFSCHNLRHTFTTRLVESGMNVKVVQDILGHADITTTMNIYADVTNELKRVEFGTYEAYMAREA